MIGIRQADGTFYEILGDAQSGHKRLVLSAARADQHGVRIELYRSTDGTADPSGALGEIALDDPQGLGYQDIEFRIDLDAAGQLEASAALPGQPPQTLSVDLTPFRESSSLPPMDAGLPPLDLGDTDAEPMTLDLPDFELNDEEAPPRSDSDILADEAFAEADLDSLDDFGLDEPQSPAPNLDSLDDLSFEDPEGGTPETRGLDEFDLDSPDLDAPVELDEAPSLEVPSLDDRMDLGAAPAFDLGDLDDGFGKGPAPGGESSAEDWEKISLDDMESMEFLDTGAEISTPTKAPAQASRGDDSFRMDDDEPLELGDFESDLSDLPDFGDPPPQGKFASSDLDTDFDQDFLPPPSLTEPSPWDADPEPEPATSTASTPAAPVNKPGKAARAERSAPNKSDGLDRMSLILSLAALSLLVLLILVLLFLNMIKAPQAPVIQPEVQRWKDSTTLVASPRAPGVETIDLGGEAPTFVTETVLEVPVALKTARVTLALEAGETADDAARRFGAPARVQGDLLSW